MTTAKKAVLLLSGGLDSSTVLAMAKAQGFEVHCLSFSYGQRHNGELEAAKAVAAAQGVASHQVVPIDLRAFGGSALTDDIEVPKGRDEETIGGGIPVTYVPARNTIFLSFALAKAEAIGAYDIFLGVNAVDFSGYPDCRPAFVEAFERLANLATKAADGGPQYKVHAPLIEMSKADIVKEGTRLGVDYSITRTCYDPVDGKACGACDACVLRRKGFEDAGIPDPTVYAD